MVDTRWLLRLFVSSRGLAYVSLGFLAGLLWLSLTMTMPTLVAPDLGMASQPVAAPASRRATLQDAIRSVRRFAGQPTLDLEGGLQPNAVGNRRGDVYYLESVGPTRGEDFFKIDARTAEVIEATFRARMVPSPDAVELTPAGAESLATSFARTHFWGFDQLTLVDRSMRTSENGAVYSFKWSQLAAESRAELPVSVSLAVAGRGGQVFWYLGQREPLQVDPLPSVQRGQAVEIARSWLLPRDGRWDLEQPSSVRLQVLYDDDDEQQLVWSVLFRARQDGPRSSLRLLVDARSGQIIQSGA